MNAEDEPRASHSEKKTIQKPPFGIKLKNHIQPPHPLRSSQFGKSPSVKPSHSDEESISKGEKRVRFVGRICWLSLNVTSMMIGRGFWKSFKLKSKVPLLSISFIPTKPCSNALLKCLDQMP